MTSFQPPRATKIEHIAVEEIPLCYTCGRVLNGPRTTGVPLCWDHRLDDRLSTSHGISLSLDEIAELLASFEKRPATARELAPWPVRGKAANEHAAAA